MNEGMSDLAEVATAVRTIEEAGNHQFALLHCVSCYPAEPAEANLRAMHTMAAAFRVPVGFSDHTLGLEVSLAAAALGASIIEKHFTLDRTWPGPDHRASLEPDELAALVRGVRRVEQSLGDGRKVATPNETKTAAVVRRSLVAAQDLAAGTRLTERHIAIKRPGTGIVPSMRGYVIGRILRVDVRAGTLLELGMLE
jgi:sialic acid synthase SpsE